jgi:hypothetical protein
MEEFIMGGTENYTRSVRDELKAAQASAKLLREQMKVLRSHAKAEADVEAEQKAPIRSLRNILQYFKELNQLPFVRDVLKSVMQAEKAQETDAGWKNYLAWKELKKEVRAKSKKTKEDKKRGTEAEAVKKDKPAKSAQGAKK